MQKKKHGLLAVPLYKWMIGIGMILFVAGVWRYYYVNNFVEHALLTNGIVTSVDVETEMVKDDDGHYRQETKYDISVEFEDAKGARINILSSMGKNHLGDEGDSVALYYNPYHPKDVMFEADVKAAKGIWVLFGFSGFLLLNSFFWYKRYKYLLNNPHLTETTEE